MDDLSELINNTVDLFNSNLVVGNHDSITLFGIQPQNAIKDYSKRVTGLMINQTEELEVVISDIVHEIDYFEKRIKSPSKLCCGKNGKTKEIIKEYNKIISYIESITTYFKLQQAQLMKEVKLLEKYLKNMETYSKELQHYIEIGKKVLDEKRTEIIENECYTYTQNSNDDDMWYYRLGKRIEDLSLSYTISLQNIAQIKMLHQNNLLMFDRIASAISNTFPVWENQMAILLGIEMLQTRLEIQDRITKSSKLEERDKKIDIDKIADMNDKLSTVLNEVSKLQHNNDEIRKELLKIQ